MCFVLTVHDCLPHRNPKSLQTMLNAGWWPSSAHFCLLCSSPKWPHCTLSLPSPHSSLEKKFTFILGSSLFLSRNLSLLTVSGQGDNMFIHVSDSSVSLRLLGEFHSVSWFWRQQTGLRVRRLSGPCWANGCLSSFAWPPVIKPPLRHFKRPAYASSSYAPSVPKKMEEHPARYKMLDQRIKLKKIQNISHNWNRK